MINFQYYFNVFFFHLADGQKKILIDKALTILVKD